MQVILRVRVEVPPDERFTAQQIRDYTRDEVEAALSRAAVDIGTILSVEISSRWSRQALSLAPGCP